MSERTVACVRLEMEGEEMHKGGWDAHRIVSALKDAGFEVHLRTAGGQTETPCYAVKESEK